jgi:ABC-type nitrate/sulfonate/bicarbonate transport system substrate-binding protein
VSRRFAAVLFAVCLALPACGGTREADITRATLSLEESPGAVHAGIHVAVAREFDRGEGVDLAVRPRRDERADLRLLDIDEAARADDLRCFMALVQTPLSAVLARRDVRSARALRGRVVAISSRRRDQAIVRTVEPGVSAVPVGDPLGELAAGDVDAAVGRIDDPRAEGLRAFRPDDAGGPSYPELVLCARPETVQDEPQLIRGTIAALRRGYDEAVRDPELAVSTLIRRTRLAEGDRAALTGAFRRVAPAFTSGGSFGAFDEGSLVEYLRWVAPR